MRSAAILAAAISECRLPKTFSNRADFSTLQRPGRAHSNRSAGLRPGPECELALKSLKSHPDLSAACLQFPQSWWLIHLVASIKNAWHLFLSGAGDAAGNMAMDHALMENAPALGSPVLRFYNWSEPAASFGYFQKFSEIEKTTLLRPLVRRPTGGGLVPHDADWTYSIAIPPAAEWYALKAIESYRRAHEWIRAAFLKLGVETELADCCRKAMPGQCFVGHEKFDVLWRGQKIAGAAQRRTKESLLIQGSIQPPPIKISRTEWNVRCGKWPNPRRESSGMISSRRPG